MKNKISGKIKKPSHGDSENELTFQYWILKDCSTDFSKLELSPANEINDASPNNKISIPANVKNKDSKSGLEKIKNLEIGFEDLLESGEIRGIELAIMSKLKKAEKSLSFAEISLTFISHSEVRGAIRVLEKR